MDQANLTLHLVRRIEDLSEKVHAIELRQARIQIIISALMEIILPSIAILVGVILTLSPQESARTLKDILLFVLQ